MNIRRAEHSRAVHVSYSKPEGALAQKNVWRAYGQTHRAIAVAELNKKQKRFYWWNVKTIKDCENIWFMCVFHIHKKLCLYTINTLLDCICMVCPKDPLVCGTNYFLMLKIQDYSLLVKNHHFRIINGLGCFWEVTRVAVRIGPVLSCVSVPVLPVLLIPRTCLSLIILCL